MKKAKLVVASIAIASVCLLSSVIALTGAWFTHSSNVETATITVGDAVTLTIDGDFNNATVLPGDTVENFVSAYAKADSQSSSMYVRAYVEIAGVTGELLTVSSAGDDWVKYGDYFYYTDKVDALTADTTLDSLTVLEKAQTTTALNLSVTVSPDATEETLIPGTTIPCTIVFQAIQSKNTENKKIADMVDQWGGIGIETVATVDGEETKMDYVPGETVAEFTARYNALKTPEVATLADEETFVAVSDFTTCGWFYDENLTVVANNTDVLTAGKKLYTKYATLEGLTYTANADGITCTVTGYTDSAEILVIPAKTTINSVDYIITTIGETSLSELDFTECYLSNTVSAIEMEAFYRSKSLSIISIPNTVIPSDKDIDIFHNCTALSTLNIGYNEKGFQMLMDELTAAGNRLTELTTINVSENDKYITSVDGVVYSKDMKRLLKFPMGKDLASFTIPSSVVTLGKDCFAYNQSITEFTVPNTVKRDEGAFYECQNLTKLVYEDGGVEYIWRIVSNDNLTELILPESLTEISFKIDLRNARLYIPTTLKEFTLGNINTQIYADNSGNIFEFACYEHFENVNYCATTNHLDTTYLTIIIKKSTLDADASKKAELEQNFTFTEYSEDSSYYLATYINE